MEQLAWGSVLAENFDLARTVESGQFFLYEKEGQGFLCTTQGKEIRIAQHGDEVRFSGCTPEFLVRFLGLGRREPPCDPVLAPILEEYAGLKVMSLDLHETILSFIVSSNSNIPKIKRSLRLLCEALGRWPLPGEHLDEGMLRRTGMGYRAPYFASTNARLSAQFLRELERLGYEQAHALLRTLPGVGPKVADCICLFALGHGEAFPVDVHIHRAMRRLFPRSRLATPARAKAFAQRRWGEEAGISQQFIFEWARRTL